MSTTPTESSNTPLTNSQIAEYRQAFSVFDIHKDGNIGREELGKLLRKFGYTPSEFELELMITEVDVDGNGIVDFPEFVGMMMQKTDMSETEELREAFNLFDVDHNGSISPEEISAGLLNLGENVSEPDIMQIMKTADIDFDGQIDFDEFFKMMTITEAEFNQIHDNLKDGTK